MFIVYIYIIIHVQSKYILSTVEDMFLGRTAHWININIYTNKLHDIRHTK